MHTKLLAGLIATGILLTPLTFAAGQHRAPAHRRTTPGIRRAIQFERNKDRADARQARIERRHPTVFYNYAERRAQEQAPPGRSLVRDPGEPLWQQHERNQQIKKQEQQFQKRQ